MVMSLRILHLLCGGAASGLATLDPEHGEQGAGWRGRGGGIWFGSPYGIGGHHRAASSLIPVLGFQCIVWGRWHPRTKFFLPQLRKST